MIDKETLKIVSSVLFVPSFLASAYYVHKCFKDNDTRWFIAYLVVMILLIHSYGLIMGWF